MNVLDRSVDADRFTSMSPQVARVTSETLLIRNAESDAVAISALE
jgi:hypothetical protein